MVPATGSGKNTGTFLSKHQSTGVTLSYLKVEHFTNLLRIFSNFAIVVQVVTSIS